MDRNNILDSEKLRQNPYTVPEGYFAGLQSRLGEVAGGRIVRPLHEKLMPYLALAASFALLVAVGTAVLRPSGASSPDQASLEYAMLAPRTNPYSVYDSAAFEESEGSYSDEELAQFLIESGITVNNLAYTAYYETNR